MSGPVLEFASIRQSFANPQGGDRLAVLDDISFSVAPGAFVAVIFAAFGIWLGLKLTKPRQVLVPTPATPFALNQAHLEALNITPRELEILTLIAHGLSNREIATQLFVSENTVKTHCSRAFDKLGASRRTQAVQKAKQLGLLP